MSNTIRCLLLGLVATLPSTAGAQTRPINLNSVFVYSVKVVCTTAEISIGIAAQGQPGIREEVSRTRVNIQNPLGQTIRYSYRAVQPRNSVSPGATFAPVSETLDAMAARSLDCGDFITLQQDQPAAGALPGNEGFLVIEGRTRLQVAAVYTQRVVKEALKDENSTVRTVTGKKNVFRGGRIPYEETLPLMPLPGGDDNSPGRGEAGTPASDLIATSPPGAGDVKIPIEQFGNGPVQGAAMGVGVGVGVGRGIGLGIGAGGGIDVEYVEPIVVPRRVVFTPVTQPAGGG